MLKKVLSLFVGVMLLMTVFCSCNKASKDNESEISSAVSSLTSSAVSDTSSAEEQVVGGGGPKPKITAIAANYDGNYPVIGWANLENKKGWTAQLIIKDLNGKTVFEADGLTGSSYTLKKWLNQGQEYRVYMYYKNADSSVMGLFAGIDSGGYPFKYYRKVNDSKYYFDGSVSLEVLNNYLNRAMTYVLTPDDQPWNTGKLDPEFTEECFRGILNVGAKYLNRFICDFSYSTAQEKAHDDIKKWIEKLHEADPDIVVEAGIFEYVNSNVNAISIPDWVFKAFGKAPENRNFKLENMITNLGATCPDVTKEETQMYFYYRAVKYIDLGCESLHMGIVTSIGKNDAASGYKSYAKVIGMIREYAKKNARRHYVFINGHGSATVDFTDENGVQLCDFHSSPMRLRTAKGETDHAVSENNPQKCDFYPGEQMLYGTTLKDNDAPYAKHLHGTSPSGWTTADYPYLLEFDNWGGRNNSSVKNNVSCIDRFNYDEISWFANQPDWYRREFLQKSIDKLVDLKDNGHLAMPGRRTAFNHVTEKQEDYWMNDAKYAKNGFSDEATIKAIWAKLK